MRRVWLAFAGTAVVAGASLAGMATTSTAEPRWVGGQDRASPYMRIYGPTRPPYGFVRFCLEFPVECARGPLEVTRVVATSERMAELDQVNRHVNRTIQAATDLEVYGVEEHWTLPINRGDCEDYALLKRHILIARGWPPSALVMTVVRDEKGEGHAVLTVRLSTGDFVLDNKVDDIRLWSRTSYAFLMRQSYVDPMVWVALDPGHDASPAAIAGNKNTR